MTNPLNDEARVREAGVQIERIARMYTRKLSGDEATFNDLVQEGWAQVAADARMYNPGRGTWAPWVRMVARAAMRRALYVQRAPVSGSPWRAVHWSQGLRGVEVEPDAHDDGGDASPERLLVGRRFIDTLLTMLRATADMVPNGALGLRVVLGESSTQVARDARVSVAVVMRAVAALRVAVSDNGALCAFVKSEHHG